MEKFWNIPELSQANINSRARGFRRSCLRKAWNVPELFQNYSRTFLNSQKFWNIQEVLEQLWDIPDLTSDQQAWLLAAGQSWLDRARLGQALPG